jgi:hypothetical protein
MRGKETYATVGQRLVSAVLVVVLVFAMAAMPEPARAQGITEYGAILSFVAVLVGLVFSFASGGLNQPGDDGCHVCLLGIMNAAYAHDRGDATGEVAALSAAIGALTALRAETLGSVPVSLTHQLDVALQLLELHRVAAGGP